MVAWLRRDEPDIAVDPVILGELRFGILILPQAEKRTALEHWFDKGVGRFYCLAWDSETGLRWAELLAHLRSAGRTMPIKHGLTVATRNRADMRTPVCVRPIHSKAEDGAAPT